MWLSIVLNILIRLIIAFFSMTGLIIFADKSQDGRGFKPWLHALAASVCFVLFWFALLAH